jgi:hypothetical protein
MTSSMNGLSLAPTLDESTSSGAPVARSYEDCSRYATFTGQPYTLDVRVWDAETGDIIERLNHTYSLRYRVRR